MILISIILALAIERLGARDAHWQIDHYSNGYLNMSQSLLQNNSLLKSPFAFALWVLLPALGVYFVMDFADFFLFELALNALLLLVCFLSKPSQILQFICIDYKIYGIQIYSTLVIIHDLFY